MALTITKVGSLANSTSSTLSFTTQNVGDCVVLAGVLVDNTTLNSVSDSNGRMTWTVLGNYYSTPLGLLLFIALGVVTTAGSTTITPSFGGGSGDPIELVAQEFQPSVAVTWALDGGQEGGQDNTSSSTAVHFPSLVPSTGGPELYVGYALCESGSPSTSGTPAGFTFAITTDGDLYCYGTDVTATVAPVGTQSSNTSATIGALILPTIPPVAPTISNEAGANAYGQGTAETLAAVVNPGGASTTVSFNYGPTSSYGSSTGSITVPATAGPTLVQIPITGLTNGSTYHFQCVATNSVGTTNGSDATFTTATYTLPTATDFPGPSWFFQGPYDPDDFLKRYGVAVPAGNITASAGVAGVSVQADNASAQIAPTAGVANVTLWAYLPGTAFTPGIASISATALAPTPEITVTAAPANVTVAGLNPAASTISAAGQANVSISGLSPGLAFTPGAGTVSVAGEGAGIALSPGTAALQVAANSPTAAIAPIAGSPNVSAAAINAEPVTAAAPAGLAAAAAIALNQTIDVTVTAGVAGVNVAAVGPGIVLTPATAPVNAEAYDATGIITGGGVTADASVAAVSATAEQAGIVLTPGVASVTSSAPAAGISVVAQAGVAGVVVTAQGVQAAIATAVASASVVAVAEAVVAGIDGLAGVAVTEASAFTAGVAVTSNPSLATVIAEALNASRFVIVTPGKATISATTPSASIDIAAAAAGLTVEAYLATLMQTVSQATLGSSVSTASIVLEVLS